MIHDVDRLSLGPAHAVLKAWLKSKVWARGNTFQWPDFKMTAAEITFATQKAHECWLEGYVLRLSSLQGGLFLALQYAPMGCPAELLPVLSI